MTQPEPSFDRAATRDLEREVAELRLVVRRLEGEVSRLGEELRARHAPVLTDEQYTGLEEALRGSFDEITRRLEVYVPIVERTSAALGSRRVLDLGCGRGEWLQRLERDGYDATGVDRSATVVAACRAAGLEVVAGDALEFVRAQPAGAWTVVSAFHFVEHLPTESLMATFAELFRILEPGGALILETPNLANVMVGSCNFYLDPTHQRPLAPEAWRHLLIATGFVGIELMPVNPSPSELMVLESGSSLETRFNDLFYGALDLGLIAAKPKLPPAAVE